MERYHTPQTLGDACALLAEAPAVIAAGCTDLFPATQAKALPGPVLDLTGIADLRGIEETDDEIHIGALTTWTDIRRAALAPGLAMLQEAAAEVGAVQIQTSGTIGGNLCTASPAADGVPPLMAAEAEVVLTSLRGDRRMPLSDFLISPRKTALAPDELLTRVILPKPSGRSRFLKLGARHSLVISIAMVAIRIVETDGRISGAAISVGSCGPVAARLTALEQALIGLPLADAPAAVTDARVAPALSPIDDIRADAAYRLTAAAELIRRALTDLSEAT